MVVVPVIIGRLTKANYEDIFTYNDKKINLIDLDIGLSLRLK
jgi:hypothetical protein